MRIAFTSDLAGLGGGETSLINTIECLKNSNEVIVICAKKGKLVDILSDKGIRVYVVDYTNKRKVLTNLIALRKILKGEDIDVVTSNELLSSLLFAFAAIGLGINNYWICHGQWYKFNWVTRVLATKCNRKIFCVSKACVENLNRAGIYNTVLIHLGIPINDYKKAPSNGFRDELNIPGDAFLIATVGRYQKIKGQLKGVKAVKRLIDEGYNVKYALVGGNVFGSAEDELYMREVETYIKNQKLEKSIFMVGERADVKSIYKTIDLLLIPSDNESFGMVAIEALAAGVPIISTPNDGVSEILEYNELMLSKTNDEESLYRSIKDYLGDSSIRLSIDEFVASSCDKYSAEATAQKYMSIYMENFR